jgi:predicted RNase H-like HicB family nuclease
VFFGNEVLVGRLSPLACSFVVAVMPHRAAGMDTFLPGEQTMLTAYINAALRRAHYNLLPDCEGCFGTIEGLQGVWASAETLEACREELREVLEDWIIFGLKTGYTLPEIDGVTLNTREVA